MKKTIEWTTRSGAAAAVTAELILEKTINADGDTVKAACCEMSITATVDGKYVGTYDKLLKPFDHKGMTVVARAGNLAIGQDNVDRIEAAIAEIKQHPAWIAKQAKITANAAEVNQYEADRARLEKMMGE